MPAKEDEKHTTKEWLKACKKILLPCFLDLFENLNESTLQRTLQNFMQTVKNRFEC